MGTEVNGAVDGANFFVAMAQLSGKGETAEDTLLKFKGAKSGCDIAIAQSLFKGIIQDDNSNYDVIELKNGVKVHVADYTVGKEYEEEPEKKTGGLTITNPWFGAKATGYAFDIKAANVSIDAKNGTRDVLAITSKDKDSSLYVNKDADDSLQIDDITVR